MGQMELKNCGALATSSEKREFNNPSSDAMDAVANTNQSFIQF
jgi:hypothetical protein